MSFATTDSTQVTVPIDVSFIAPDGGKPGAWKVLHADGTELFSCAVEMTARKRCDALRDLAKIRLQAGHQVTGQDMLTLFPPTAPAPLVMGALSATELMREDVLDAASNTWTMRNVEIFRSGTALKCVAGAWKTLSFTADDVTHFVEAFAALGWQPPVKIGHGEDQAIVLAQLPALARVTGVRSAKVKDPAGADQLGLFADLAKVPTALRDAIRDGRLFQRSIEFWTDQIPRPDGTGKFARALKAVALLGSDLPAVPGMPPIDIAPTPFAAGATDTTVTLTMEIPQMDPTNKGAATVIQLSGEEYEKLKQSAESNKAEAERLKAEQLADRQRIAKLEADRRVESATSLASRLRDSGKITPAQEPLVLEILKGLDDDKKDAVVVTLSTKDGTAESKSSQRAAFLSLLESFPKHPGAPSAGSTKGGAAGGTENTFDFGSLSLEKRDEAIAALGEKYAADAKKANPNDTTKLTAFYERARKDLTAGKVTTAEVIAR